MKNLIRFGLILCFSLAAWVSFAQSPQADPSPLPIASGLALHMSWKEARTYLAKTFPGTKVKPVPRGWMGGYQEFVQTPNGIQVPLRNELNESSDDVTEIVFAGASRTLLGWNPGMSNQDLATLLSAKFQCDIKPTERIGEYLLGSLVQNTGPYFLGAVNSDVVVEIGTGLVAVYSKVAFESGP